MPQGVPRVAICGLAILAITVYVLWLCQDSEGSVLAAYTSEASVAPRQRTSTPTRVPPTSTPTRVPPQSLKPPKDLIEQQGPQDAVKVEQVQSLDQWAFEHPWLFARGPCSNRSTAAEEDGPAIKRAVFVGDTSSGTYHMRGEQLAAAMGFIPGWQGVATTKTRFTGHKGLFKHGEVAFCSFVRYWAQSGGRVCHENGALVYYDVLDNTKFSGQVIKSKAMPAGIDVLLSPTRYLADIAETGTSDEALQPNSQGAWLRRRPVASVVRHQVANPGVISDPISIVRPHICRIGLLAAAPNHIPKEETLHALRRQACQTGVVHRFTMFLQRLKSRFPRTTLRIDDTCNFKNSTDAGVVRASTAHQCQHLPPPASGTHQPYQPSQMAIEGKDECFGDQWVWHDDAVARSVDVGLIWQRSGPTQRPSTRFVYWCSHGVPVIIGIDQAAREVAREHDYTLPNGEFPFVNGVQELSSMVEKLADPWVRLRLRSRGYEIAAKYSVLGIAHKLVDIWKEHQP